MPRYKRSVTIQFDAADDQEYSAIANLLWHVMEVSHAGAFWAYPDGKTSPATLNQTWADLDVGTRWS